MATNEQLLAYLPQHEQNVFRFSEWEAALNAILFARIVENKAGAQRAIEAHKETLDELRQWYVLFAQQMLHGWLLQQKATQLHSKGDAALLQQLSPWELTAHHTADDILDESDAAILDVKRFFTTEINQGKDIAQLLTISQFMSLLTIGMLHKLRSVNFATLERTHNLGNHAEIATQKSYWIFNWEPESVHKQLRWLKDTGHWVLCTPHDLVMRYPLQFLKFAHFVSAFVIAGQESATKMRQALAHKETKPDVSLTVFLLDGMESLPQPTTETPDTAAETAEEKADATATEAAAAQAQPEEQRAETTHTDALFAEVDDLLDTLDFK